MIENDTRLRSADPESRRINWPCNAPVFWRARLAGELGNDIWDLRPLTEFMGQLTSSMEANAV